MTKSKFFNIGFLSGLIIFTVLNIYTYDNGLAGFTNENGEKAGECFDCLTQFGWPLRLHQSGTILHLDRLLWSGLIIDILVALVVSTSIGLLCRRLICLNKQAAELKN
jgi:hypothetical protein